MSELSFSNTKSEFSSSNLFSIFFHFCFSIFSHPLYFSYFLFFSPYILKLLSFLSPLFITTTLLLVALLTFTPNLLQEKGSTSNNSGGDSKSNELCESKFGFFLSLLQTFLAWTLYEVDHKDEEIGFLGELEAYLVMFQASIFEVLEPKLVEEYFSDEESSFEVAYENFEGVEVISPMEEPKVNMDDEKFDEKVEIEVEATNLVEVKSLETLFQETNNVVELEDVSPCQKEVKEVKVKTTLDAQSNKVEESKEHGSIRKVVGNKVRRSNSDRESAFGSPQSYYSGKAIGNNEALGSNNLGSFGSMRVEKEWRRTLACKLFEERHNGDQGSEGMDMLWETYEKESNKGLKKSNTKKGKKSEIVEQSNEDKDKDEEEEEEEEIDSAKLCCLQALKFSTGKMNLGMGRPNLLKFSKALKGIGWLHNVGKHGKKNNH